MALSGQSGNQYTFTRSVTGSDPQGPQAAVATLTDAAGNVGSVSLGVVTVDYTPPGVAAAGLTYTPGPGNPLLAPQAATQGTRVTLVVTANEPLDTLATASLTAQSGANTWAFDVVGRTPVAVIFSAAVDGSVADGNYLATVTLQDVAGNTGSSLLSALEIVVDTSLPPTSAIHVAQVKQLRLPWGGQQSGHVPAQYLVPVGLDPNAAALSQNIASAAFQQATEASAQVRVYASAVGGVVLGASNPNAGAWTPVQLTNVQTAGLWVSLIDVAGNESARVLVRNAEWVASAGGLAVGNRAANPHAFVGRGIDWAAQVQSNDLPVGSADGIGSDGDGLMYTTASGPFWRPPPSVGPGYGLTVYDSKRGRLLLFPQVAGAFHFAQPYAWQNGVWTALTVTDPELDGNPNDGTTPCVAYDIARDRVVIQPDFTWEFTGSSWQQMSPTHNDIKGQCAYDPYTQTTLVLSTTYAPLFEWDGVDYVQRAVTHTPSGPTRSHAAVAFDVGRNVLVMQGGRTPASMCDDLFTAPNHLCRFTYELDGTTWDWAAHPYSPATDPNVCANQSAAYDPILGKVVMYGGITQGSGTNVCPGLLWTYDGSTWATQNPTPSASVSATDPGLAYSAADAAVLTVTDLWGGTVNSLLAYDGNDITVLNPNEPTASNANYPDANSLVAYSPAQGTLVAFGGAQGQTWLWDGQTNWTALGTATTPSPRQGGAMAFDTARNRLWMFGGRSPSTLNFLSELWGLDSDWTLAAATGPTARSDVGWTYDANRQVSVLFGGQNAGGPVADVQWEWNGSAWTQRCTACTPMPAARSGAAMAFDPLHGVTLLFGGTAGAASAACPGPSFFCNDTWTWDGHAWQQQAPAVSPAAGLPALSMTFEPRLGIMVLTGGTALWGWDGAAWFALTPQSTYQATATRTLFGPSVYDPNHQVIQSAASERLDTTPGRAPAHQFCVDLAALTLPNGETATYSQFAGTWWTGASGPTGALGSSVAAYSTVGWQPLATHSSPAAAPGPLGWSITDPNTLQRSVLEDRYFYVKARSRVPSNGLATSLSTDAVEVRISYSLTP